MRTSQWGAQTGWHRYEQGGGAGMAPRRRNRMWLPFAALALLLVVGGVAYAKFDPSSLSAIGNASADNASANASDPDKGRQTKWGPLTAADEDMVKKVMTANFWEGEMGTIGLERSQNPKVRQAAQVMADDHNGGLRKATLQIAQKLKVPLPQRATEAQRKIMEKLDGAEGEEFDLIFVNSLRNAHGVIYPALANMYTSTKNTQVRSFTGAGLAIVFKHIGLLNATGLVDDSVMDNPSQTNVARPLDADDGGVGAKPNEAKVPTQDDVDAVDSGDNGGSDSGSSDSDSNDSSDSGSSDSDSSDADSSNGSSDSDSGGSSSNSSSSGGSAGGADDSTDLDPASSEQVNGVSRAPTRLGEGGDLEVIAILAILGIAVIGNFLVFRSRRKGARTR
jgi:putative membrane protein